MTARRPGSWDRFGAALLGAVTLHDVPGLRGALSGGRALHPVGPPIEKIAADLRRLSAEAALVERTPRIAAAATRLHVLALAYDDTLVTACAALEVEPPASRPFRPGERLVVEAELARRGLRW